MTPLPSAAATAASQAADPRQSRVRRGRRAFLAACAAAGPLSFVPPPSGGAIAQASPADAPAPRGDVEILRDGFGVPHVYAGTTHDLFFGYGYAVAEDRLFQIEMAKRTFTGRVAEVLGPDYVAHDTATRRLGDPESIRRQLAALPPDDRTVLAGYAAGVNRRIAEVLSPGSRGRLLPRQFAEHGFEPQPWTDYDVVMIFVGTVANRFGDATREVENLAILRALEARHGEAKGAGIFSQMFWASDPLAPATAEGAPGDPQGPTHAPPRSGHLRGSPEPARADGGETLLGAATASNIMVLGARRAAEGRAVLLNGPQFGSSNPAYVYAVGLHGAGFDVVGNTPFAYPAVLFGHNGRIAWGSTAGPNDVVDTYEERLNPANPTQYMHDGRWRDMERRVETVEVKGAAPVRVELFRTVHGPVMQRDERNGVAYARRRSWDGREVQALFALLRKTRAGDWREYRAAAEANALPINWYYADREGNIGYVSCGLIPDRPANQSPWLPASGAGDMEWRGFLPFERNPQVFNPARGHLLNWNNRPSAAFANNDAWLFSRLDRTNLLRDEFEGRERLSADDLQAINRRASFADVNVDAFLPYLEQAVAPLPPDSRERRAVALVRAWQRAGRPREDQNGDRAYDAPALPIFRAWLAAMLRATFADEFDPAQPVFAAVFSTHYPEASAPPRAQPGSSNVGYGARLLVNALLGQDAPVPQTHDFFNGERPSLVVRRALRAALDELARAQGPDMARWRDGAVPHEFNTRNFLGVPQAGADEARSLPVYMNRGTENNLATLDADGIRGFDVTPPGQSGFVAPDGTRSPHYEDQLGLFGAFRLKPQLFGRAEVEAAAVARLVIPAAGR